MEINSKEFWENEFKTSWTIGIDGRKQTQVFAEISYGILSKDLKEEFLKLDNAFIDWGCALGQGCQYFLSRIAFKSRIIGIDISNEAIKQCKLGFGTYSYISFYNNLNEIKDNIDLIYTSNTLEHFYNPEEKIKMLLNYTKKFLIILVPYNQKVGNEHFFMFTEKFFMDMRKKYNLKLRQYTVITPIDEFYSPCHQVFVVFEKRSN